MLYFCAIVVAVSLTAAYAASVTVVLILAKKGGATPSELRAPFLNFGLLLVIEAALLGLELLRSRG